MKKAVIVFLLIMSASMFTLFVRAADYKSGNKRPAITGIVKDTNGNPIKDVEVFAQSRIMGNNLYRLVRPSTLTDENGYFNLPVDFDDIKYDVTFQYLYNNKVKMEIIPAETKPLKVQLEIKTNQIVRGVVINSEDSKPAAGATIKFKGTYQEFLLETKTDSKGKFEFTHLPFTSGLGDIYAQLNDKVSPVVTISNQDDGKPVNLQLKLDSGVEIWGTIKAESTDKPLPNFPVSINNSMYGQSIHTTTDANGVYRFHNLPPAGYFLTAENENYFQYNKSPFSSGNEVSRLSSGQKVQKDLKIKKRMRFEGKVVDLNGKPVEGAVVGINEAQILDKNRSPFVVRTDSKGKFSITTGRIDITPKPDLKGFDALKQIVKDAFTKRPVGEDAIEAFDSKGGYGKFQFSPYREGDVVKGIKIVLNGYIRIHGKVTDQKGNPLEKVNISTTTGPEIYSSTDEQGRYDFGQIPIYRSQAKQGTITFFAPRPGGTTFFPGENLWIDDINNHAEKYGFFHHHRKTYDIVSGKDIEINVSLEPTDLITLYGTVTDSDNRQVEDAEISLFGGNADPTTWFELRHPRSFGGSIFFNTDEMIYVTKTDTKGYWKIILARETKEDMIINYHGDFEPGHFSIGVYKNDIKPDLIQDIIIDPNENETEKEINIKIEKTEPSKLTIQIMG